MKNYIFANELLDRVDLRNIAQVTKTDNIKSLLPYTLIIQFVNGKTEEYDYYKHQHRDRDAERLKLKQEMKNDNQ
jgi:hypothetical protein